MAELLCSNMKQKIVNTPFPPRDACVSKTLYITLMTAEHSIIITERNNGRNLSKSYIYTE